MQMVGGNKENNSCELKILSTRKEYKIRVILYRNHNGYGDLDIREYYAKSPYEMYALSYPQRTKCIKLLEFNIEEILDNSGQTRLREKFHTVDCVHVGEFVPYEKAYEMMKNNEVRYDCNFYDEYRRMFLNDGYGMVVTYGQNYDSDIFNGKIAQLDENGKLCNIKTARELDDIYYKQEEIKRKEIENIVETSLKTKQSSKNEKQERQF